MGFILKKNRPPTGAFPEALHISAGASTTQVTSVCYSENTLKEAKHDNPTHLDTLRSFSGVRWIDIQGLGDRQWLEHIGETFGLHYLTIADVAHVPQRPKFELHDGYIVFFAAMSREVGGLEQVSIILCKDTVITFQEHPGDVFDPVRERLRSARGAIRKSKADYLFYALLDTIVDGYYPLLEKIGEDLELLEEEIMNTPDEDTVRRVYLMRRELLQYRRVFWPLREALGNLIRDQPPQIRKTSAFFFRDVYDHLIQIIDVLESYRELSSSLMEVYLSSANNRLNEVMKKLTVIATIFIPLSFFASVYGMNFEYMPELQWRWSYPLFWCFMLLTAAILLYYFAKRGWLK